MCLIHLIPKFSLVCFLSNTGLNWFCVWFGFTPSARFRKECRLMSTVPFLPSSRQARLFPGWGTEASETLPVHILPFTTSGKTTNQPERPTNSFPLVRRRDVPESLLSLLHAPLAASGRRPWLLPRVLAAPRRSRALPPNARTAAPQRLCGTALFGGLRTRLFEG